MPSLVDLMTSILGLHIPAVIRDKDFYKPQPWLNELFSSYQPAMWQSLLSENQKAAKKIIMNLVTQQN